MKLTEDPELDRQRRRKPAIVISGTFDDSSSDEMQNEKIARESLTSKYQRQSRGEVRSQREEVEQDCKEEEEKVEGLYPERYLDQMEELKEHITSLQSENQSLRDKMRILTNSLDRTKIQDLEEEVHKWEKLYVESAQVGAAQMAVLENELQRLRFTNSFQYMDQMDNDVDALSGDCTLSGPQVPEAINDNRCMRLIKELELGPEESKSEQTDGLNVAKRKLEVEVILMEQIARLETELNFNNRILELERHTALNRQKLLEGEVQSLRQLARLDEYSNYEYRMQDICTVFMRKLGRAIVFLCD